MKIEKFFEQNKIFFGGVEFNIEQYVSDFQDRIIIEPLYDECSDNKIYLNDFFDSGTIYIKIGGTNNTVVIGKDNGIHRSLNIAMLGVRGSYPHGATVVIGDRNYFNGNVWITGPVGQGRKVVIGSENLFADRILFLGRNDHGIFDINTGKLLNEDEDVILGDKSWICKDVEFYPGAYVAGNSIVAAHSIVNKEFREKNVLIAGIPGVVKKRSVMWCVEPEESAFNLEDPLLYGD